MFEHHGEVIKARARVGGQVGQIDGPAGNHGTGQEAQIDLYAGSSGTKSGTPKTAYSSPFIVSRERDDAELHYQRLYAEQEKSDRKLHPEFFIEQSRPDQGGFSDGTDERYVFSVGDISTEAEMERADARKQYDGTVQGNLDFEKQDDGYYTIVSIMPHNTKIKGTLIYPDGSANPFTVIADGALIPDGNNKSDVKPSANTHANINAPSDQRISQEQTEKNTAYEQPREASAKNTERSRADDLILCEKKDAIAPKDTNFVGCRMGSKW